MHRCENKNVQSWQEARYYKWFYHHFEISITIILQWFNHYLWISKHEDSYMMLYWVLIFVADLGGFHAHQWPTYPIKINVRLPSTRHRAAAEGRQSMWGWSEWEAAWSVEIMTGVESRDSSHALSAPLTAQLCPIHCGVSCAKSAPIHRHYRLPSRKSAGLWRHKCQLCLSVI